MSEPPMETSVIEEYRDGDLVERREVLTPAPSAARPAALLARIEELEGRITAVADNAATIEPEAVTTIATTRTELAKVKGSLVELAVDKEGR